MSSILNRRKFLKLTGVSAAAAAVLTGCGPAARYVVRKPYYTMPEFGKVGASTFYATTCRECPAGCGLILRTIEGRAIKAEGNPAHPVSQGKICSRGLTAVQGLYNPDRVQGPVKRAARGEDNVEPVEWDAAIDVVSQAMGAGGAAFLMGLAPDHLFNLVSELAQAAGIPAPTRYSVTGMLEGRSTLIEATRTLFGSAAYPYFDIANADLVFSFGADFMGTWMSPVSYSRAFGTFRRTNGEKKRGYMVSFEPRMSITSGAADEWIPVAPGSEGLVAQAIAQLAAEAGGQPATGTAGMKLEDAANASGVSKERLRQLAERFAAAERPLAIAGGSALSHANGLASAISILRMNQNRIDQPGGMWMAPAVEEAGALTGRMSDLQDLVTRMKNGQVQTLFVHGVNPVFDLPAALGFEEALQNVPLVISFASYPDETALLSDYVLPDHTALESWGYQTNLPGTPQTVVSAMQPVVAPLYNTRATADVLLEAGRRSGNALNYSDEVAYLQAQLAPLLDAPAQGASFTAPEIETFWATFLQKGGWWMQAAGEATPAPAGTPSQPQAGKPASRENEEQFHLVTYPTHFGDGSAANRPWIQETPDAMTTVTWNTWVEINPKTAEELGIHHDDLVRVRSAAGEIEAPAYLYPAIRPDTVAIPFGQGHTALGRYAEGRGVNPMQLLEVKLNESGDLAFGDTLVTIEKTGRRRPLARVESIKGVYGEH